MFLNSPSFFSPLNSKEQEWLLLVPQVLYRHEVLSTTRMPLAHQETLLRRLKQRPTHSRHR